MYILYASRTYVYFNFDIVHKVMRSPNVIRISIRRPNKMPINLEDNLFSVRFRISLNDWYILFLYRCHLDWIIVMDVLNLIVKNQIVEIIRHQHFILCSIMSVRILQNEIIYSFSLLGNWIMFQWNGFSKESL